MFSERFVYAPAKAIEKKTPTSRSESSKQTSGRISKRNKQKKPSTKKKSKLNNNNNNK